MTVSNPKEVPEYELNPLELEFRRGEEVTKACLYKLPHFFQGVFLNVCILCKVYLPICTQDFMILKFKILYIMVGHIRIWILHDNLGSTSPWKLKLMNTFCTQRQFFKSSLL
jgi:hypothetical protein